MSTSIAIGLLVLYISFSIAAPLIIWIWRPSWYFVLIDWWSQRPWWYRLALVPATGIIMWAYDVLAHGGSTGLAVVVMITTTIGLCIWHFIR
jgi:hypothetical protein